MATAATNPKQEAHELIERISVAQASAVVTLITSMLDPVDRAIANAPFDRALESNIQTLARLVDVDHGRVQFALPHPARDILGGDEVDRVADGLDLGDVARGQLDAELLLDDL